MRIQDNNFPLTARDNPLKEILENEREMSHRGGKISLERLEPTKKLSIQHILYNDKKTGKISGYNTTQQSPRIKKDVTERMQIQQALNLVHGGDPSLIQAAKGTRERKEHAHNDQYCGEMVNN